MAKRNYKVVMANTVTNNDIMEKLGGIEARLVAVQVQAEKTNGRVNSIENWKNALEAIDQYKRDNPVAAPPNTTVQNIKADTVNMRSPWYMNEKFVGTLVAIILTVITVISYALTQGIHK